MSEPRCTAVMKVPFLSFFRIPAEATSTAESLLVQSTLKYSLAIDLVPFFLSSFNKSVDQPIATVRISSISSKSTNSQELGRFSVWFVNLSMFQSSADESRIGPDKDRL